MHFSTGACNCQASRAILLVGQERNRESRDILQIYDHAAPSSSEELGKRWRETWLTLRVHLRTHRGVLQAARVDSVRASSAHVVSAPCSVASWKQSEVGHGGSSYTEGSGKRYKSEPFCSWESRLLKLSQDILGLESCFLADISNTE